MEILGNIDLELIKNIFDAKMRGDLLSGGIYLIFWRELHGIRLGLSSLGLRVDEHERRIGKVESKPLT